MFPVNVNSLMASLRLQLFCALVLWSN